MGTTNLDSAPRYQGPGNASFTSVDEAEAGKGAEGQAAPDGTTAVAVEPGDTISELMSRAEPRQDWNNPQHRAQFLADNPQFAETGGRNPDLIWPGEVVYVRNGEAPPPPADTTTPQVDTSQAVDGTPIRSGPYTEGYGPYMPNTTVTLKDGSSLRIGDTGYPANGPVASACNVDGTYTYQNYQEGRPVGEPYTSVPDDNGQPTTQPSSAVRRPDTSPVQAGSPAGTPQANTDTAAQAYWTYNTTPYSPATIDTARQDFATAVRAELDAGGSVDAIKARYGNDAWMGAAIDAAAAGR